MSKKAEAYINDEVATVDEAIQGALDIIAEHVSDNPKYRSRILKDIYRQGNIVTAKKKKRMMKKTFAMYYDYVEPIKNVANHRVLAMNRGEKEKYFQSR